MVNDNTRKCNLLKKIINFITSVIAIIITQIIVEFFFEGSFIWTLIIMVIILAAFIPLGLLIDKKIDAYYKEDSES